MSSQDAHRRTVAAYLGREVNDNELLIDVLLEAVALLSARVEALEERQP